MSRRKIVPARELERRRSQSEAAKGVTYLSDFQGGSIKAVPLKGGGYKLKR